MSVNPEGSKWFGLRTGRRKKSSPPARGSLRIEQLEDRITPAINVGVPPLLDAPEWTNLGPTQIINGQLGTDGLLGNQQNAVAGAVVAFAVAPPDPTHPHPAFVATTSAGVWQTADITQTAKVDVNQIDNPALPPAPDVSKMTANTVAGRVLSPTDPAPLDMAVYKVTFVDAAGVESNASLPVAFPVANMLRLGKIPTGPEFDAPMAAHSTVRRNIYRLVPSARDTPAYYGYVGTVNNFLGLGFSDSPANTPAMTTARWETVPSPKWVAKTDNFASLAMSALTVDPDNSVAAGYVVYAGSGQVSSAGGLGDVGQGLLVSADGGNNWSQITSDSLAGVTITGIQVGSRNGVSRTLVLSTDTGIFLVNIPDILTPGTATVTRPAGPLAGSAILLPEAAVSDLAAIPASVAGPA
uniref:hypothetical protein n=1 Tax=Zavarzinella formosa TaxID=360055 RepID=UPI0005945162